MSTMNYQEMSNEDKNLLVKKYENLVYKMTLQYVKQGTMDFNSVKSMAYEGLVLAFNRYDEKRSNMSFLQYAAFSIRNNILSSLDKEMRTVYMSAYQQNKATEAGDALWTTVSVDEPIPGTDGKLTQMNIIINKSEEAKFSDGDVYDYLYNRLEEEFSVRDCLIFYKFFGLKEFEEQKGKDLAVEFNLSAGHISAVVKKIIVYIRKDNELCEMLANLLK